MNSLENLDLIHVTLACDEQKHLAAHKVNSDCDTKWKTVNMASMMSIESESIFDLVKASEIQKPVAAIREAFIINHGYNLGNVPKFADPPPSPPLIGKFLNLGNI